MKNIQKLFKFIFSVYFIFLGYNGYVQTKNTSQNLISNHINTKKNIHEISYQFPFMFGYTYYHNFNNKIAPGLGLKLGYGYLINGYYGIGWSEFLSTEFKLRNVFSKVKYGHLIDYDIGLTYSLMPMQAAHFYGVSFQTHIKIVKFIRIGISLKVGNIKESNENPFVWLIWHPYFLFTF